MCPTADSAKHKEMQPVGTLGCTLGGTQHLFVFLVIIIYILQADQNKQLLSIELAIMIIYIPFPCELETSCVLIFFIDLYVLDVYG